MIIDEVEAEAEAEAEAEVEAEVEVEAGVEAESEVKIEVKGEDKGDKETFKTKIRGSFGPVDFRISEAEGLLVVKFLGRYDPEWIDELRSYGQCNYDKRRKEWLLSWSKMTTDSLADYFAVRHVKVNVTKQVVNEKLRAERKETGEEIRSRPLGTKALNGLDMLIWYLDENRYSPRTRESYLAMLEFFFRYFSPREPGDITEEEKIGRAHV